MSYGEIKTTINSKVGTAEFKPLNELIYDNFATLSDWLANDGASKVVKSVQRGNIQSRYSKNPTTNITLSTINPNKSLVIIDMGEYGPVGEKYQSFVNYTMLLSSNNLQITQDYYIHGTANNGYLGFNWQVIEFY